MCTKGRRHIIPDSECSLLTKPPHATKCELRSCPTYHWFAAKWSKVSNLIFIHLFILNFRVFIGFLRNQLRNQLFSAEIPVRSPCNIEKFSA